MSAFFEKSFKIISFNCHGIKGSMSNVSDIVKKNDIRFVCEHRLMPGEISTIKDIFKDKWINFKSSIDPETRLIIGRPYGGVGLICQKNNDTSYRPIDCSSDRICGVEVIVNHKVALNVIGVYLPYENNTREQLELYLETTCRVFLTL